jgi:PAS domain S-box-containing protein
VLAVELVAAFAVSIGAFALEQAHTGLDAKVFWNQIEYVGDAAIPAFLLGYVLVYIGYDLDWRHYAGLFVLPTGVLVAVFTNGFHFLYWNNLSLGTVAGYVVLDNGAGPLFYLYIFYTYLFVLVALGLLILASVDSESVHRRHVLALGLGTVLPAIAGIAYVFEVGPTPTPNYPGYAYILTAGAITYSVTRHDVFTVVPIARRTSLERMDDAMITLDSRGLVVNANRAARSVLDVDGDLLGRPCSDVFGDLDVDINTEYKQETTVETDTHVFDITVTPLRRADSVIGRLVTLSDVTDRHRREQELEELNTRLKLALAETDTGVWDWNLETDEVFWDEACERLYGYEPDGFPGTFEAFTDRVHPDDLPTVEADIEAAIETGELFRTDFRIQLPDGGKRWLQSRGIVEYDGGEAVRMVGVQTDITTRKEYERELTAQNEQLELLTTLVGHDIRNEANLVLKGVRRCREGEKSNPLDRIEKSGTRIVDFTEAARDLVEVISQLSTDPEPVELVRPLRQEIANASTLDADATVTLDTEIPAVHVAATGMLDSVFRNLLTNAIQHNDSAEPEVRVAISKTDTDVTVEISDNGPGIPKSSVDTVFEERATLRDSGGTGYGLSLVESLVDQYGGSVQIGDADRGLGGTTVSITLPIAEPERNSSSG